MGDGLGSLRSPSSSLCPSCARAQRRRHESPTSSGVHPPAPGAGWGAAPQPGKAPAAAPQWQKPEREEALKLEGKAKGGEGTPFLGNLKQQSTSPFGQRVPLPNVSPKMRQNVWLRGGERRLRLPRL